MLELLWLIKSFLPLNFYSFLLEKLLVQFWQTASEEEKIPAELLRVSERGILLDSLFSGEPCKNILELGCGYGQNFWFIKRLLPYIYLTGVERDQSLLPEAKITAEKLKLKNVNFLAADAAKKLPFPDKNFDLSYTCAALLYSSADEIHSVISELIRVTKNKILILEQHKEDPKYPDQALGIWVSKMTSVGGYWIRDYQKLLERFPQVRSIKVEKVPKPRFLGESWLETACLIEIELVA